MNKKNLLCFFLVASFLSGGVLTGSTQVQAEGVVTTKGQIELTKPSGTEPSETEPSTTPSGTGPSDTGSSTYYSGGKWITDPSDTGSSTYYFGGKWITDPSGSGYYTKPEGRYPSTGELVKTSLSFSGGVLLLSALVFYFWKRKKQTEEGGEGE